VLAVLRDEKLIERSARVGEVFLRGLIAIASRHAVVREARGRGLMLAMELRPDAQPSVLDAHRALLERGFLVGCKPQANLLRFYPPLTIGEDEIRGLLAELDRVLGDVA